MKHRTWLLTVLSITAFAVGCDKSETTSQKLDQVQARTQGVVQDRKDYTFAQRAEFTEKMQSQMAEINRELDQLSAKIEKSSDAAIAEAKPKLQTLRDQAGKLNQLLDEAKNATESTWGGGQEWHQKSLRSIERGLPTITAVGQRKNHAMRRCGVGPRTERKK